MSEVVFDTRVLKMVRYSLIMIFASSVFADSPRALLEQGNAHYAAGRYAEALAAYRKIDEKDTGPYQAEWLNNRAAAHFKLGQYAEAREAWVRAAALKDPVFEAAAHYNLGNCNYAEALKTLENAGNAAQAGPNPQGPSPTQQALELLERAAQQYRDAIRLDPNLTNARANLELARNLDKQIREMRQQSQPSSQPQSNPSSQSSSQPSSQQSQQDQSGQQGQDQSSASQPSSQSDQQKDKQRQKDEQQKQEQEQPPQTQPAEPPQQPESQPSQSPQSQPTEPQPAPQSQPSPEDAEGPPPGVELEMSKIEAERLLQKVREAERARRRMLMQREALRHRPVDRDW